MQTQKAHTYISTVGHHEIGSAVRKRPEGVWQPLRPRLGFEHAAEHRQGLNIPEPAVMRQPEDAGMRRVQMKSGIEGGQQL